MIIIPQKNQVYIKLDEVRAGVLDTSSRMTAVESAEVIAVGECSKCVKGECDCSCYTSKLRPGARIFVKAWAIDNVDYNGQKYAFVNTTTNGVLAVFKEDE